MSQLIHTYIKQIQTKFDTGGATEHTYRITLETLLLGLSNQITVTNEHERIRNVGMPDFTIKSKKDKTIPLGRIEAKDLHISLEEKKNADQLKRYTNAFDNFIYTNYLTFVFYRNGKKIDTVSLGQRTKTGIERQTDDLFDNNIIKLENLLKEFLSFQGITITSPEKLAKAMAQKAQLIKFAIQHIFDQEDTSLLEGQYQAFKDLLVHDLTKDQFADMYAQTVAYGLFTARLYDPTLPTFSREEAERLIPKSTPFIRWLFKQMSNDDEFDERIAYIIDDLVHIFLHCNVAEILKNYGKKTKMENPIIHFYETFLGEYDSTMRKKRGVYYTPLPIVQFIVRGVDHLLREEFGLDGLVDTSKIETEFAVQAHDHRRKDGIKKEKRKVHRVQVLDPATGTGTFLHEVVQYIYNTYFSFNKGARNSYITNDLLPRIRGFEILMASYTMAHLKLGMILTDTGWTGNERVNIYLTNSLEEPHDNLGTLFSQALARESEQASKVKREQPIMVVMGNPPYSVSSSNKGKWIQDLIKDYKKDLNEKKLNLDDDYVKFIRYAEHFIEKNNEGILAYITNNTYIDGVTFRQMRKKLLETFDTIYIIDLHGNSKKREQTPSGGKDENVFDIMQGVSIIFGIKKGNNKKLATVYHTDMRGKREWKYASLVNENIASIKWKKLEVREPYYFFVSKNHNSIKKYKEGVDLKDLALKYNGGVQTDRDDLYIDGSKNNLGNRIKKLLSGVYNDDFIEKYRIKDSSSYKINEKMKGKKFDDKFIQTTQYKILDFKYIYYDPNLISRAGYKVLSNMIKGKNIAFCLMRTLVNTTEFTTVFCSKFLMDKNFYGFQTYLFPLYLYNDDGTQRKPNLDPALIADIIVKLGATRTPDGSGDGEKIIGPEDIFDYIYAVLHSPSYRETYQEFLKIDFPRVPFTENIKTFWQLVALGHQLRELHLMESVSRSDLTTSYPVDGDNIVEITGKKSRQGDKVFINETQYFEGVSDTARNFWIGGYQPAQKRLKDRKGETLSYDDILHYQKIIYVLDQTHEIMQAIDEIDVIG